jgi:large subunit ribosomal protein L29
MTKLQKKIFEIRQRPLGDLRKDLSEKRKQLFTLRLKQKTMQLTNTSEIREKRKEIAKIQMAITEKLKSGEVMPKPEKTEKIAKPAVKAAAKKPAEKKAEKKPAKATKKSAKKEDK